jgi:hypothetical protein
LILFLIEPEKDEETTSQKAKKLNQDIIPSARQKSTKHRSFKRKLLSRTLCTGQEKSSKQEGQESEDTGLALCVPKPLSYSSKETFTGRVSLLDQKSHESKGNQSNSSTAE